MSEDEPAVDFAIAAYRDESQWQVAVVPPERIAEVESVEEVVALLRQQAYGAAQVLGLISVDDDFFVLVRAGEQGTKLLLSDATAAHDWPLARSVLDAIGRSEADDEEPEPAGDLAIAADLGLDPMELDAMSADTDLYPDEVLGSVAARLGFGDAFQRALDELPD